MSEICFNGMTSDGWGSVPARRAKSNVRAKVIGYGLAAAFSTTAILAFAHPQGFSNSSWGGLIGTARDQISNFKVSKLTSLAKTATHIAAVDRSGEEMALARTGRVASSGPRAWLPEGMNSVALGRSSRLVRTANPRLLHEMASVLPPQGMREEAIGRSTRLALAEPAPSEALVHKLKAAQATSPTVIPLPAVGPLVETASREPKPVATPAIPDLPPQPPVEQALALPTTAPEAPGDKVPQPMVAVPLPEMRPKELAETAPATVNEGPQTASQAVVAEAEPSDGIDLPSTAPVPSFRPQREVENEIRRTAPQRGPQSSTPRYALAYASPDTVRQESNSGGGLLSRIFGGGNRHSSLASVGPDTAVYSIKDATVYMPDGTKLEAHSGMGAMTDNPRYTNVRMRGPTPVNVYNLSMRKQLFHGVEAVRLTPENENAMHGRDGMLAHTYMLRGRPGESNGCVVFKNYPRFLRAFKSGKIDRMVVVASLSDLPRVMASR